MDRVGHAGLRLSPRSSAAPVQPDACRHVRGVAIRRGRGRHGGRRQVAARTRAASGAAVRGHPVYLAGCLGGRVRCGQGVRPAHGARRRRGVRPRPAPSATRRRAAATGGRTRPTLSARLPGPRLDGRGGQRRTGHPGQICGRAVPPEDLGMTGPDQKNYATLAPGRRWPGAAAFDSPSGTAGLGGAGGQAPARDSPTSRRPSRSCTSPGWAGHVDHRHPGVRGREPPAQRLLALDQPHPLGVQPQDAGRQRVRARLVEGLGARRQPGRPTAPVAPEACTRLSTRPASGIRSSPSRSTK